MRIDEKVGWQKLGSEIVAFNSRTQVLAIWNQSASILWEMLENGCTEDLLVNALVSEYQVERGAAGRDVSEFIHEASVLGFIEGAKSDPTCISANEVDGENILREIEMEAIKQRQPLSITFELTYLCNEHCIHCYMERHGQSLSTEKICGILSDLYQEGCLFLSFTGGEFLMRTDALEILEHAAQLHFVVDILSNGTLITQSLAKNLAAYPVRRVQVSLYGASAPVHDGVTRVRGSFDRTMQGIRALRAAGIKVEIACPLMDRNFHEREQIQDLAKSVGAPLSLNHIITARNSGEIDTYRLRLDDNQLRSLLHDPKLYHSYAGRKPFKDHQLYLGFQDIKTAPPCFSGFNTCAINPVGVVYPCNQLLFEVGNLQTQPFQEIWTTSPQLNWLRNLKVGDLQKCCACPLLPSCSRCPGLALLEGGDILGPSPENCRISEILFSR